MNTITQTAQPNAQSASHTPGPWHRNIRREGKYPVVFSGRNQHVATACQQENAAETEANIDLIAAAPDLLAALEEIEAYAHDANVKPQVRIIAIHSAARAALARAKGVQS